MKTAESKPPIAAFFDLDGTLLPLPSLERRLLTELRHRGAIPPTSYFRWLAKSMRLLPRGISAAAQANKMYLHNLPAQESALAVGSTGTLVYAEPQSSGVSVNQATAASARARRRFPAFFSDAIDRIVWHVESGHGIVLVTGTLAELASQAALALLLRLAARGITTSIAVCATQLEQANDRWTGRVTGEVIFGEAKLRAVEKIAAEHDFDLAHSYAYGDSANDRLMLGAVGRPTTVNPEQELERIARLRNWPVLRWREKNPQTHSRPSRRTWASIAK
jgi:HAD superfamily hydrolase (TIGR01490 family)